MSLPVKWSASISRNRRVRLGDSSNFADTGQGVAVGGENCSSPSNRSSKAAPGWAWPWYAGSRRMKAKCGGHAPESRGQIVSVLRLRRLAAVRACTSNAAAGCKTTPSQAGEAVAAGGEVKPWVTFWFYDDGTSPLSAKCWTSPCAARATRSGGSCRRRCEAETRKRHLRWWSRFKICRTPTASKCWLHQPVIAKLAVILITAVNNYKAAVEAVKAGGAALTRKFPGLMADE